MKQTQFAGTLGLAIMRFAAAAEHLAEEGVALASLAEVALDFELGVLAEPNPLVAESNPLAFSVVVFECKLPKVSVWAALLLHFRFIGVGSDILSYCFRFLNLDQ